MILRASSRDDGEARTTAVLALAVLSVGIVMAFLGSGLPARISCGIEGAVSSLTAAVERTCEGPDGSAPGTGPVVAQPSVSELPPSSEEPSVPPETPAPEETPAPAGPTLPEEPAQEPGDGRATDAAQKGHWQCLRGEGPDNCASRVLWVTEDNSSGPDAPCDDGQEWSPDNITCYMPEGSTTTEGHWECTRGDGPEGCSEGQQWIVDWPHTPPNPCTGSQEWSPDNITCYAPAEA